MRAETTCPSDETIAELVCRRLGEPEAEVVEAHIADCAACRQLVGTLAAASLPRLGHGSHDGGHTERVSDRAAANDAQRYVIRRELARGGMGRISIADDTFLGRTVAIKELLVPSEALAARFRRELSLTARLQHPSIVSIHDGGLWPSGEPFYVMRLVSGEPLDRVIARHDGVASRLGLLPHGIAMVDALAYAHSQGVIHRDLKPSNVLVGDFGETIVIDWGLAKDLRGDDTVADVVTIAGSSEPAAPVETIAGLVIGTPAYMAPEQARGEPIDERADVYALGAVLYHVFAGAPPHRGDNVDDIVRAVRSEAPIPLVERAIGIPPGSDDDRPQGDVAAPGGSVRDRARARARAAAIPERPARRRAPVFEMATRGALDPQASDRSRRRRRRAARARGRGRRQLPARARRTASRRGQSR